MPDTAVYVGAGTDIKPLLIFKYISTFIYIDSQPLTEFGNAALFSGCARPKFPLQIYQILTKHGFIKTTQITPNLHEYYNPKTGRTLKYYMNCCFPKDLPQCLLNDIKTANTLICCGHSPPAALISMMKSGPKTFIGDNKTCYNLEQGDEQYFTVDQALREDPSLMTNYMRFDIPQGYPYWEDEYTDITHTSRFIVSSYKSIEELYKKSR
jgi:hypothetical protein